MIVCLTRSLQTFIVQIAIYAIWSLSGLLLYVSPTLAATFGYQSVLTGTPASGLINPPSDSATDCRVKFFEIGSESIEVLERYLGDSLDASERCARSSFHFWFQGRLYAALGRWHDASTALERALLLSPSLPGILMDYAHVRYMSGAFAEAAQLFDLLLREHIPSPELRLFLEQRRENAIDALSGHHESQAEITNRCHTNTSMGQPSSLFLSTQALWCALVGSMTIEGARAILTGRVGFDANLNSGVRLAQIALTSDQGAPGLALDPQSRPRRGSFGAADWYGDINLRWSDRLRQTLSGGVSTRLTGPQDADHASVGLASYWVWGSGKERLIASTSVYRSWVEASGGLISGRLKLGKQDTFGKLRWLGSESQECAIYRGAEFEQRHFTERTVLNGNLAAIGAALQCNEDRFRWEIVTNLGIDRPLSSDRAGGLQRRKELSTSLMVPHYTNVLRWQVNFTQQRDSLPYSDVFFGEAVRQVTRLTGRWEYEFGTRALSGRPLLVAERYRQNANIPIFALTGWAVYLALRYQLH